MKKFLLLLLPLQLLAQRPNIIYIMSDDHDNDAISLYNKQFIQTPVSYTHLTLPTNREV